jgi:hypothetical protein
VIAPETSNSLIASAGIRPGTSSFVKCCQANADERHSTLSYLLNATQFAPMTSLLCRVSQVAPGSATCGPFC